MTRDVRIGDFVIRQAGPPFVVAEIGGNFTNLPTAVKLIDLAREVGVDAVKLQHYTADTIASRKAIFDMENTGKMSQYELFKKHEIDEKLSADVFAYCREKGITAFSTPSHRSDVALLEKQACPAYKIGSDDTMNTPFLKYIAGMGKPIILSTGMCTLQEVEIAVNTILAEGNDNLVLLHCTTNYPTHPESVNLLAMRTMMDRFPFPVGYSDHTIGIDVCYTAAVLGARMLEFHFTHDKKADGPDHMLSKDAAEAGKLIRKIRQLPVLLGDGIKRPAASEMSTRRNNRKSLVVIQGIKCGEKISAGNIEIKRPGYGIPCTHYYDVLGKTASRSLDVDDVLTWEDIS